MNSPLRTFLFRLVFLVAGGCSFSLKAQTNALEGLKVRQGLKLAEVRVHDPFIVAHQPTKTYYLYTASGPR